MENTYQFTEKERLYFERLQQEFQTGVSAGIRMIVTQQDLRGQWRVKADASGLESADSPQFQMGSPAPDGMA